MLKWKACVTAKLLITEITFNNIIILQGFGTASLPAILIHPVCSVATKPKATHYQNSGSPYNQTTLERMWNDAVLTVNTSLNGRIVVFEWYYYSLQLRIYVLWKSCIVNIMFQNKQDNICFIAYVMLRQAIYMATWACVFFFINSRLWMHIKSCLS